MVEYFYFCYRLPKDIKNYRVILMDATVATGAGMGTNSHLFYFLAILASGEVASALIPELQEEITSRISNNSPPGATWFNDNILLNNAKSKILCK